jgi:hypothetical protein
MWIYRGIGVLVLIAGLSGCQPDPENPEVDHLPRGSEAITYSARSDDVLIKGRKAVGNAGPGWMMINVGTRVVVVDDPEKGDQFRDVRVRIEEGEFADEVGMITRQDLRPTPR